MCSRIQPPGIFHQVYTVEKSLAIGGHFVLEDAMHLTEWCRYALHKEQGSGTNAYHSGMKRVFARHIMAIAERGPTKG